MLDADAAGYEVLRMPEVEAAVEARWGRQVFGADGRVDRARLAEVVFAAAPDGPRERKHLEQLLHPRIARVLRRRAEALASEGCPVAVLDAPLLFEAGWDELCEKVVFVDAPRRLRLEATRQCGPTSPTDRIGPVCTDSRRSGQEPVALPGLLPPFRAGFH